MFILYCSDQPENHIFNISDFKVLYSEGISEKDVAKTLSDPKIQEIFSKEWTLVLNKLEETEAPIFRGPITIKDSDGSIIVDSRVIVSQSIYKNEMHKQIKFVKVKFDLDD